MLPLARCPPPTHTHLHRLSVLLSRGCGRLSRGFCTALEGAGDRRVMTRTFHCEHSHSPSNWKKSQNESGLAMGSGLSSMESCDGLYVVTPLGTREKKFSNVSLVPVSLERTMESVIHCSRGLSRASSYCVFVYVCSQCME